MANLYTGYIESNGEYVDLEEATGLTFTQDTTYQIQYQNKGYLREGEVGEGFLINFLEPITIKYVGDTIYLMGCTKVKVNFAG